MKLSVRMLKSYLFSYSFNANRVLLPNENVKLQITNYKSWSGKYWCGTYHIDHEIMQGMMEEPCTDLSIHIKTFLIFILAVTGHSNISSYFWQQQSLQQIILSRKLWKYISLLWAFIIFTIRFEIGKLVTFNIVVLNERMVRYCIIEFWKSLLYSWFI